MSLVRGGKTGDDRGVPYGRKDQEYVVDLCDGILGERALREHRFDWLLGDPNRRGVRARLPVDAFYPQHRLVIEYWESEHDISSAFFDKRDRLTVSGVHRGEQRARYDQRRQHEVPCHGLTLVIIRARDLVCDRRGRLLRDVGHDRAKLTQLLTTRDSAAERTGDLPPEYAHVNVRKNYANPVVRRMSSTSSKPGRARASPASLVAGVRSQRVTSADIVAGRIRFPASAKRCFPSTASEVEIDLRGHRLTARWNPRNGPDRPRSGVLSVGQESLGRVVEAEEVLTVRVDANRIVLG